MIEPFEAHWLPLKSTVWRNILECFPKNKLFLCNRIEKDVNILGEMGWVNYREIFILEVN